MHPYYNQTAINPFPNQTQGLFFITLKISNKIIVYHPKEVELIILESTERALIPLSYFLCLNYHRGARLGFYNFTYKK